ncbi:MAG: NTP transferase domain-containing protein [Anaeromyxobacteraceae bacterium]
MNAPPPTAGLGAIVLASDPVPSIGLPRGLAEVDGEPLVRRAARTAVDAGLWPVVVVVGDAGDRVRSVLAGMPLVTVRDTACRASAIRAGLKRLKVCCPDLRGTFVMGCDPPFADEHHLDALAAATAREGKPIAASSVAGAFAGPAVVLAEAFEELAALSGDDGAAELAAGHRARVAEVPLDCATAAPRGRHEGPTESGAGGPDATLRRGGMGLSVVGKAHEAGAGGPFTWFVYGSSLDRGSFESWARDHGYEVPSFQGARPAVLRGFRLAFDVASRSWGGAVASLAESPGDHVEGLAVPMPGLSRGLVEHKEGVISGLYTAFPVTLEPVGGGASIAAIAFRAAESRRLPVEGRPVPAYLEAIVRGAASAGLSKAWVDRLGSLGR